MSDRAGFSAGVLSYNVMGKALTVLHGDPKHSWADAKEMHNLLALGVGLWQAKKEVLAREASRDFQFFNEVFL